MSAEVSLAEPHIVSVQSNIKNEKNFFIAHRSRIVKTIALFLSFLYMGMGFTIFGPTLVHLQLLFCTSTAAVSSVSIAHGISWVIGAFLCGAVYDGLNTEFVFGCATCVLVSAISLAPWIGGIYGYYVLIAIVGFSGAYLDTGSQSYTVSLWDGHRFREPVMQCVHMLWSLGSALGPIIANPFLIDLNNDVDNNTMCDSTSSALASHATGMNLSTVTPGYLASSFNSTALTLLDSKSDSKSLLDNQFNSSQTCVHPEGLENVRYVFVAISGTGILSMLIYFAVFFSKPPYQIRTRCKKTPIDSKSEKTTDTLPNTSLRFRIIILALLFLFLFFDTATEVVMGFFLTAFVMKGYCWPVAKATMLSTVFWAIHGIGRIVGIPLSLYLTPIWMMTIDLVLCLIGFILMVVFAYVDISYIWATAGLAGLGMATLYPTTILWTANIMPFTGKASAVISMGAALGSMCAPAFTGKLFDEVGPISVVYITVVSCALQCIIFVVLVIIHRFSEALHCTTSEEKQDKTNGDPAEMVRLTDVQQGTEIGDVIVADKLDQNSKDI